MVFYGDGCLIAGRRRLPLPRGRSPTTVILTEDERQRLNTLARRSRSAPQLARRARVILAGADGQPTTGIAHPLHVSATTVWKWRKRFLRDRIDRLGDEACPGDTAQHHR